MEKRPRIKDGITAKIDEVRGDVPYERWVNRALEWVLEHRDGVKPGKPAK